jgi:predicted nucleotidyltransferase
LAEPLLPADLKEFLRLLNEAGVEYLLIGGYAVGCHGYPRATADMDVWVGVSPENAARLVDVFRRFGMDDPDLKPDLFLQRQRIIRVGMPPLRLEVFMDIDGVDFADCYAAREVADLDGLPVNLISLRHLRINKRATGRHKDLDDLEHLPKRRPRAPRRRRRPGRS